MSPRSLTENEKEHMKSRFYEKGRELLLSMGVRKSSVEDITKLTGMSKGSFYLYFTSKEEFFFDIFEQYHNKFKKNALDLIDSHLDIDLKTRFKGFLLSMYLNEENAAFFLRSADLEYLLYKLPPEKLKAHVNQDNDMFEEIIKYAGIELDKEKYMVVSNLIKAIFLTRCSAEILNTKVMEKTLEVMIDGVLEYIFAK